MRIKNFIIQSANIERDSFLWNMIGSILYSCQSVFMLVILTKMTTLDEAGIFSIAQSISTLFLTVGKYGMRNYQVSDNSLKFSFSEYRSSRYITTCIMLAVSFGYILFIQTVNSYTLQKSIIIILMCILKAIDSLEDIYYGFYQQQNRLDIAGKCLTIRIMVTLFTFILFILVSKQLIISLLFTLIISTITCKFLIQWTIGYFHYINPQRKDISNVFHLLLFCFPLFLGSFLTFYIINAPKFAIDKVLNDELQACYGFISLPLFAIGLLNNFIFNPIITKISYFWKNRQIKQFITKLLKQSFIILFIIVICELLAFLFGIPVLSFIFSTDLTPYQTELLILLLGGGFLALSGVLSVSVTVMRLQYFLSIGYIAAAVIAYFLSPVFVAKFGILGASLLYASLQILQCIFFSIPLLFKLFQIYFKRKKP